MRSLWSPPGPAWLALLLVFGVTITTLLWNIERTIFGQVLTSDWLSLLNVTAAVITSLATSLYLYATWQLLRHSRDSHEESQNLMTRLHADSLAPYVTSVNGLEGMLSIKKNNEESRLLIYSMSLMKYNRIRVNDRIDIALNDVIVEGALKIKFMNTAKNPASVSIEIADPFQSSHSIEMLSETDYNCEFTFKRKDLSFDTLKKICDGTLKSDITIKSHGPGLSAIDYYNISCKWPLPSRIDEKLFPMIYEVSTRRREYLTS